MVEDEELDVAEICFLVVGHTHCSVDRYFSTISNAINAAEFIPTPMALRAYLAIFETNESRRPKVVRLLEVYIYIYIYTYNGAQLLAFYMHSSNSAASLSLLDCYHLVKFAADNIGLMTQCIKFKNVKYPPRGYHKNVIK